jgi:hypothetical protein
MEAAGRYYRSVFYGNHSAMSAAIDAAILLLKFHFTVKWLRDVAPFSKDYDLQAAVKHAQKLLQKHSAEAQHVAVLAATALAETEDAANSVCEAAKRAPPAHPVAHRLQLLAAGARGCKVWAAETVQLAVALTAAVEAAKLPPPPPDGWTVSKLRNVAYGCWNAALQPFGYSSDPIANGNVEGSSVVSTAVLKLHSSLNPVRSRLAPAAVKAAANQVKQTVIMVTEQDRDPVVTALALASHAELRYQLLELLQSDSKDWENLSRLSKLAGAAP